MSDFIISMQKAVVYIFLFLISFAFSCETLVYFSKKISERFAAAVVDFEKANNTAESDEDDSESGNSGKKANTLNLLEDLYIHDTPSLLVATVSCKTRFLYTAFSSSDYSRRVFFPPDSTTN